jgi:outer membrane biosynthesis protein TonB
MRRRARQVLFRTTEIFDYRTVLVAGAFVTLLLIGYLIVGAIQAAHDANVASNQRGKAASRRIDGLQQTIADQAQTIATLLSRQARSDAEQAALARQVQQLGGQPVVSPQPKPTSTVYVVRAPSPRPSPSSRPSPKPSPRKPSPSPSPTCLVPILGC